MKIKKGDNVIVISGAYKGKTGSVVKVLPELNKVLIDGINMKKVHEKKQKTGSKGQVIEKPAPLHASNVLIVDPKTKKPTRIRIEKKNGSRVRIARKSGSSLS